MKITVKSLQGDEYYVDVQNDQSILNLKSLISEKANGLPIERLKLVYKGRTMQDPNPVSEYNLVEGCKVHLIVQKDLLAAAASETLVSSATNLERTNPQATNSTSTNQYRSPSSSSSSSSESAAQQLMNNENCNFQNRPKSKFEIILRERLGKHFSLEAVNKIMANLEQEIDADINSSSLDDLERLAKQKLNINNE